MDSQSVKQHQQSEIFFILFLLLMLVVIILQAAIKKAEAERSHQKPPIITLPEASGYRFKSGSAELEIEFQNKLSNEITPALGKIAEQFEVDVIEVIGHTDGQKIKTGKGNLDTELEKIAHSNDSTTVSVLTPSSNADLGLMRALSVIKFFQLQQKQGRLLEEIQFRPYSAAQLLLPNGQMAPVDHERKADSTRRRIELRFTRSSN